MLFKARMPSARSTTFRVKLLHVLLFAQLIVALLALRNWAYVTTYRLYLEQRTDEAGHSTAAQRFDVEGSRVVPRIVTHGHEQIAFNAAMMGLHLTSMRWRETVSRRIG